MDVRQPDSYFFIMIDLSQFSSIIVPNYLSIKYFHIVYFLFKRKTFPVWFRNRLLSAGLEPVLNQTEKSCIASNYRQFSTNIKIKFIKLIPVLSAARGRRAKKTGINFMIFILIFVENCL